MRGRTVKNDEVLAFLDDHPDFLGQHASRFGLKSSHDRVVVSFAERQILELRDQNRQLEARLIQLVRHGEQNDLILARCHQLSLALMQASTLDSVADAIVRTFDKQFGLDRIALRLWHPAANPGAYYLARQEIKLLANNLCAPYCGPYASDEVLSWFPAQPVLQSFASIALRHKGEAFGMLVLASDDSHRFAQDMQTHYLAQMGELVSAALQRVLSPA